MAKIKTDPLFLGLTRPAMVLGVSFTLFIVNMMFSVIGFSVTSDFRVFLLSVFFHVAGVVLCKKEPLAIDLLFVRLQKCPAIKNKQFYHGLNSYDKFTS